MDDRLRQVEISQGRVEQRVDDHENDIRVFASLPTELEKIRWGQEQMHESLDAAHAAIRELSERIDREHVERVEGQALRKREIEEAREERNLELAKLRDRADQQKAEGRKLLVGLAGIFLTSAGAVLAQILGAGSP